MSGGTPEPLLPYDAVETPSSFALVVELDQPPAPLLRMALHPRGVEATFSDGRALRFGNVHPGLVRALPGKVPHLVAIVGGTAHVQRIGGLDELDPSRMLGACFYWYVGPESDGAEAVAARPLPALLGMLPPASVAVAPGRIGMGPPIGLCLSEGLMTRLARGRRWITVAPGLVAEESFVSGTSAGHAADSDVAASVLRAHDSATMPPPPAARMAWRGSYACVVEPD